MRAASSEAMAPWAGSPLLGNVVGGAGGVGMGGRFDPETPQGPAALTERLDMGMNDGKIPDPGAGHAQETVVHLVEMLPDDLQGRERHQVVDIGNPAGDGILDRQHGPDTRRRLPPPGRRPRRRGTAGLSWLGRLPGRQGVSRHRACPGRRWCCRWRSWRGWGLARSFSRRRNAPAQGRGEYRHRPERCQRGPRRCSCRPRGRASVPDAPAAPGRLPAA